MRIWRWNIRGFINIRISAIYSIDQAYPREVNPQSCWWSLSSFAHSIPSYRCEILHSFTSMCGPVVQGQVFSRQYKIYLGTVKPALEIAHMFRHIILELYIIIMTIYLLQFHPTVRQRICCRKILLRKFQTRVSGYYSSVSCFLEDPLINRNVLEFNNNPRREL